MKAHALPGPNRGRVHRGLSPRSLPPPPLSRGGYRCGPPPPNQGEWRGIGACKAIDELAIGKHDDFLRKPFAAQESGELLVRWPDHEQSLPIITAALALDARQFGIYRPKGRETDKARFESRLDALTIFVICADAQPSER